MGVPVLVLSQLTGTRDRAIEVLAVIPEDLRGMEVVVDAGHVIRATDAFTDELVRTVLVDRQAERLTVTLVGPNFEHTLRGRGRFYKVMDRLTITSGPLLQH